MRSQKHPIVFTPEFLDLLAKRERKSSTAPEAEYAGPWRVVEREQGFAVLRESDGEHAEANAQFVETEIALLVAAVFPTVGREKRYRIIKSKEKDSGFDVQAIADGRLETIGWLCHDHPEILDALHVVEWLLRSPSALAAVLEAASFEALSHAGRILEQRLAEEERS